MCRKFHRGGYSENRRLFRSRAFTAQGYFRSLIFSPFVLRNTFWEKWTDGHGRTDPNENCAGTQRKTYCCTPTHPKHTLTHTQPKHTHTPTQPKTHPHTHTAKTHLHSYKAKTHPHTHTAKKHPHIHISKNTPAHPHSQKHTRTGLEVSVSPKHFGEKLPTFCFRGISDF